MVPFIFVRFLTNKGNTYETSLKIVYNPPAPSPTPEISPTPSPEASLEPSPRPTVSSNPGYIVGDIDRDGDVDIYDLNIMIENFGRGR